MTIFSRILGICEYQTIYAAMKAYTDNRDSQSRDEIWHLQHLSVYTLGLAGKAEHILESGTIPVIQSDRGGQVTYHGPGQLVSYLLIDLKRQGLTIKGFVYQIEAAVIDMLKAFDISAERKHGAPGVYVDGKKIAALGVRVRKGCSYHGLAINVDMDTAPFTGINPCGYPELTITQLKDYNVQMTIPEVIENLQPYLLKNLGFDPYNVKSVDGLDVNNISIENIVA